MGRYFFRTSPISWVRLAVFIFSTATFVVLVAACSSGPSPAADSNDGVLVHDLPLDGPAEGYEVGQRAPAFTLRLADDSTLTSTGIIESGRPTFLFFWATT